MKKLYTLLLAATVALINCTSCKIARAPQIVERTHTVTETVTVTETIHDTLLTVATDSAQAEALFICDSNNRVLLTSYIALQGKAARLSQRAYNNGQGLRMIFECKCDSQAIYFAWKQHDTTATRSAADLIPVIKEIPAPLTLWQNICIKWGPWAFGIIAALLAALIARIALALAGKHIPLINP